MRTVLAITHPDGTLTLAEVPAHKAGDIVGSLRGDFSVEFLTAPRILSNDPGPLWPRDPNGA